MAPVHSPEWSMGTSIGVIGYASPHALSLCNYTPLKLWWPPPSLPKLQLSSNEFHQGCPILGCVWIGGPYPLRGTPPQSKIFQFASYTHPFVPPHTGLQSMGRWHLSPKYRKFKMGPKSGCLMDKSIHDIVHGLFEIFSFNIWEMENLGDLQTML